MSYTAKSASVDAQQLLVQRLVLPFTITGASSSTGVVIKCDVPDVLFLRTQGVDQITAALAPTDAVPSFGDAPVDSTGVFNMMVVISETMVKVCSARLYRRGATIATSPAQLVSLGTATGIVQLLLGGNSDKLVLSGESDLSMASGSNVYDACLEVEYIVKK